MGRGWGRDGEGRMTNSFERGRKVGFGTHKYILRSNVDFWPAFSMVEQGENAIDFRMEKCGKWMSFLLIIHR